MPQLLRWLLTVTVILGSISAPAQWVPLVGKIRQTREVIANGQVQEKSTKAASFYRSSTGSTLRQWTEVNGVPTQRVIGELLDNKSGTTYRVDYRDKQALVRFEGEPHGPDMYKLPQLRPLGHDTVAGVTCSIVSAANADTGRDAAKLCISPEYGLLLRVDASATRSRDGSQVRIVTEFYELTINKEPDAKLFDLTGLSVLKTVPVNKK